ncbi:MAG: hypothetical protein ACTS8R_02830 [Arsenophonus sp. NC-QC1-MAG3]
MFSRLTDEKLIADMPAYNLLQKDKSIIEMMIIGVPHHLVIHAG